MHYTLTNLPYRFLAQLVQLINKSCVASKIAEKFLIAIALLKIFPL